MADHCRTAGSDPAPTSTSLNLRSGLEQKVPDKDPAASRPHSTVTLFARFLGWSTSVPFSTATW
jgi:hypothetical protein